MKKIALLAVISVFTLVIFSCKTVLTTPEKNKDKDQDDPAPEYYIHYKVNGTGITETEVSGVRSTDNPRTLTVLGSKKGANPKFKFITTETAIGFVAGLNVGCSYVAGDSDYVEYINDAGKTYTTISDTEGIWVFLAEVSYKKDGIVKGRFNGRIKDETGGTLDITEGEFRVKFSN